MILAHLTASNWIAIVGPIGALLGAVATGLWRFSQAFATFRSEHNALMRDLKARSEQLEKATPGISPLPESAAVREVVNGA